MGRYARGALLFMFGLAFLAVAGTVASLITGPGVAQADWATCALLAVLAAIAHLYPVKSAKEGVVYSVANAFLFAGVLLLPGWQLTVLCFAALLPVTLKNASRPGAFIRFTFNVAQSTLACQIAGTVIRLAGVQGMNRAADMAWILIGLGIWVAIQLSAVAEVIALNHHTALWKTQVFTLHAVMADSITPFFGAVMAALWYDHPWVLVFSSLPVILAYRLMRQIQLVTMADVDSKTGLYNFRYFQEAAQEELRRSGGLRRPVAFLFCDLDYLREVNNNYGHLAGDKVLDQIATLLVRELPSSATISRFGGEEFVAMLPGIDGEEAHHTAERLRLAVANHQFSIGQQQPIHVTMCVGISCAPADGTNLTLLAERADKALYQAKNAGRNRVCVWKASAGTVQEAPATTAAPPAAAPAEAVLPPAEPAPVPTALNVPPVSAQAPRPPVRRLSLRSDWDRVLVVLGGAIVLVASLGDIGPGYRWTLLATCVLAGIAAEFLDVRLLVSSRHAATVSPAVAAGLAAGALLGPSGSVLVALGSATAHSVRSGSTRHMQHFFNLSLAVLSNYAAGLVFQLAGTPSAPILTMFHLFVGAIATLVYFVVNTGLLALVLGNHTHRSPVEVWWQSFGWLAPQFIMTGLTGVLTVHIYRDFGIAGFMLGGLLAVLAYFSVTLSISGHQKALEESSRLHKKLEEDHLQEQRTIEQWVRVLASVIDARDGSVGGHSEKVAYYATALAEELGAMPEDVEAISLAALLHDLGKVGVPEVILNKPTRLAPEEWAVMKQHPTLGERLLSQITALSDVARMVGEHHERYDGLGYPYGRRGSELSLGGRIITLCDALDTMLSGRPYASPRSPEWALQELRACAGKQFDPLVVEALGRLIERNGPMFLQVPPAGESSARGA